MEVAIWITTKIFKREKYFLVYMFNHLQSDLYIFDHRN